MKEEAKKVKLKENIDVSTLDINREQLFSKCVLH